jgi:hypothetical protein
MSQNEDPIITSSKGIELVFKTVIPGLVWSCENGNKVFPELLPVQFGNSDTIYITSTA